MPAIRKSDERKEENKQEEAIHVSTGFGSHHLVLGKVDVPRPAIMGGPIVHARSQHAAALHGA